MKVVERKWNYGTYLAYEDVEPEFLVMKKDDRVLPAPSFYEKRLHYSLIKRYEPGENKYFPNGGFEVRGPSLEVRSYELDQVILHPDVIKRQVMLAKMRKRVEKNVEKLKKREEKALKKAEKQKGTGKRGRPALSPEEKSQRELIKREKSLKGTGKRGRPKGTTNNINKPVKIKDPNGKRGRKPLSPEIKAQREKEKELKRLKSGGKRGRPSILTPEERAAKYAPKGYGKRGRPKKY